MTPASPQPRMPHRAALLTLTAVIGLLFAVLTLFAIELTNTQAKSRADIGARVHERGRLSAALISSLFNTVEQQVPSEAKTYGTRTVSVATLQHGAQTNAYLALLGPDRTVIAATRGFTAQARANLQHSAALALVSRGLPYGLGNVLPYGSTGVINLAAVLPTPYGRRILLSGFLPAALSAFLGGELKQIPGVKGSVDYIVDGNGTVIGSTSKQAPVGTKLDRGVEPTALAHRTFDTGSVYWDQAAIANATWRVVQTSPDGPLFASVSGLRKWIPWIIFAAFAAVALLAVLLATRMVRASEQIRSAKRVVDEMNTSLEAKNAEMEVRAIELATANAELERSNDELQNFASVASHDLQEPLRKIQTFGQQLQRRYGDDLPEEGQEYVRRMASAATRMRALIEDMLEFSRVATRTLPFEPVDLAAIAATVVDDCENAIQESHATIEVGDLPTIEADRTQMRQLIQNLLMNAIKFRRHDVAPHISITARTVGDGEIELIVADNGIGFEPEFAEKIFGIFERLHGRTDYEGTGIGLAVCRKIARRHGGEIHAEGEVDRGATFIVRLLETQPNPALMELTQ